ncbi:hypothetical protein [Flavobacterium sp. C4GT6]|uniref:hypothetical protein n=1 Tax=Flavobacterium sp. C4GT6 TaxID=3103818 RepID=UPI002ED3B2AF
MTITFDLRPISKKVIITELLLFILPTVFLVTDIPDELGYYYLLYLMLSAFCNLVLIILHVVKDGGRYIWMCLLLFFLPVILLILQLLVVNITC